MWPFYKLRFKRSWIILILAVIIGGVAVSFILRPKTESLSQIAPDGTLAYVEIKDPTDLVQQLSTTRAWTALAPTLGWPQDLSGLGYLRHFIGLAGLDGEDLQMFLTSQIALVVTGIDTSGGELAPHLALLFQPKATTHEIQKWMEARLKPLADRAYGTWEEAVANYAGQTVHVYKSHDGSHRIAWCVMDHLVLVANQMDSIQSILDTRDHRRPSLKDDPNFQRLRALEPTSTAIFGYLTTQPVASKLQQFSWPTNSSSTPERLAVSALQILLTSFDISLAYRLEVQDGMVVERYHLPAPSDFNLESIKSGTASESAPRSLPFIPQQSKSFTILHLGELEPLVDELDAMLSRRLSAISSIALREIIIRFKRTWGLNEQDTIADAIGNEITVVEGNSPELLFVVRTKRKAKLAALIGKYLQHDGATVQMSQHGGLDIYSSSDQSRKAFCFVDDLLLMGPIELVNWAITAQQQGTSIDHASEVKAQIEKYGQGALEISVRLDREEEARRITAALQHLSSHPLETNQILGLLRSLPPTIRTTRPSSQGLLTETRSPLGEIPFWLIEDKSVDESSAFKGQ